MSHQRICGTVHDNIANSNTRSRAADAINEMVDQLNRYSSDTTFTAYTPVSHGFDVSTPKNCAACCCSFQDQQDWQESLANDIADAYYDNEFDTFNDGDVWLILHGFDVEYGYGGFRTNIDVGYRTISTGIAADMAHSLSSDPNIVTKNILIQEAAHAFGADHNDGNYELTSDREVWYISPMVTSYMRVDNDADGSYESDTCSAGSGHVPDSLCERENKITRDFCSSSCGSPCRWSTYMTDCTLKTVDNNAPIDG